MPVQGLLWRSALAVQARPPKSSPFDPPFSLAHPLAFIPDPATRTAILIRMHTRPARPAATEDLLGRVCRRLLECPQRYPMDKVLAPAVAEVFQRLGPAAAFRVPALRGLVEGCAARLAEKQPPPAPPPARWRRQVLIKCRKQVCPDCPVLQSFLLSDTQSEQRFAVGKIRREHLLGWVGRGVVNEGGVGIVAWRVQDPGFVCRLQQTGTQACPWLAYDFNTAESNNQPSPPAAS